MKEYITLRGYKSDLKVEKEDNGKFTFTIIDEYAFLNTLLTPSQIFGLINWLNEQNGER